MRTRIAARVPLVGDGSGRSLREEGVRGRLKRPRAGRAAPLTKTRRRARARLRGRSDCAGAKGVFKENRLEMRPPTAGWRLRVAQDHNSGPGSGRPRGRNVFEADPAPPCTLKARRALEVVVFSDRLRQPDNLRRLGIGFLPARRLTALRPCLAAGLPLSCAIVRLRKRAFAVSAGGSRGGRQLQTFKLF